MLFRAAAAILVVAGAGSAFLLLKSPEPSYSRLSLRVVVESGNGDEEDQALREEIFGPETPIFTADGGEALGTGR